MNACETSKPYPTCGLIPRNPLEFLDLTLLITLPVLLVENVSRSMAQKPSRAISISNNIKSLNNVKSFNNVNSFNVNSFNIVNSFNNIVNVGTGALDEDDQIREWLSPLKPQQRHQDIRADRLDGVGNWFLETGEFRKWSGGEEGSPEGVLFCSGGPGVGKTYLWQERPLPEREKRVNVTDKCKILVP